jgi:hypothetical protein
MSHEKKPTHSSPAPRAGWNQPRPEKLPEPTAWPAGAALAITFILWGLVGSFIVSAVGVALFVTAMAGWIREIRHEREQE